jgi:hypothetical protein
MLGKHSTLQESAFLWYWEISTTACVDHALAAQGKRTTHLRALMSFLPFLSFPPFFFLSFFLAVLVSKLRASRLARQALYYLSHTLLLLFVCFSRRVLHFSLCQAWTEILLPLPPQQLGLGFVPPNPSWFWDRVLLTFCPSWPWMVILLSLPPK